MIIKKNKKILLLSFVVFTVVFVSIGTAKIKAGSGDNALGWLWGGGTELDGAFPGDGTNTNVRWISMNSTDTASAVDYGVNIPMSDGDLSGEAWSGGDDSGPGLGYITFDASRLGGCPSGTCSARRIGDQLEGWARFEQIAAAGANSGGWSGWISLSGVAQNGSSYGVSIDSATGQMSGYAWSDELGWIDFSGAKIDIPKTIEGYASADPNLFSQSDTAVSVTGYVNGGTATGGMVYELDCENDGTFEAQYPTVAGDTTLDNSHEFTDGCVYSASATPAIRVARDGVNNTFTTKVVYGCMEYYCDTSDYVCKQNFSSNPPCTTACDIDDASTCQKPSGNWIEVAP